jgi:hypothetical protein
MEGRRRISTRGKDIEMCEIIARVLAFRGQMARKGLFTF